MPETTTLHLIGRYINSGYEAVADAVMAFFDRRTDLQRPGVAFGAPGALTPAKVSTDISLVAIDRSDPESCALSEVIVRGVSAGLDRYLQERPLFREVCPDQELFVLPIFNLANAKSLRLMARALVYSMWLVAIMRCTIVVLTWV